VKRALTVSEARKQLPRLLREIARGGGPFLLGPRGEPLAVLSAVPARDGAGVVGEGLGAWEGLRLQIVGSPATIDQDIAAIRREAVSSSLESWDRGEAAAPPKPPAARRKARR
jgi:antitoxin (DNA-binding transcriptional repressor) of toxin-antitoxin stability system